MTHRQILEALSGLLLGMFVAILSSTVVSNALPTILAELHGGQSAYTWVITATLLATTATTPIWGKLADLTSKKLLVQIALVIFVVGSALAGLSQSTGMLIACRVVQGIGVGGLTALAQVIMAAMISPRERGRYSGYLGAVFAVATIGGPLIGGVIVDTSWLGWRWCFYVGVPFAVIALVVLQKTLKLPVERRKVSIDYAGATLIVATVSLLLIWVSLAGDQYPWWGWETAAMLGGTVVLALLAVLVETRAPEPIIPMSLFRHRTVTLATVASLMVGMAMFGATTFLSQYFQLAKGYSPTESGLMTIPMIAGLFLSSTIAGRLITRYGRWKIYLILGGALLTAGMLLMGGARADTEYWQLALFMLLIGLGIGMSMQNLVLAVQNTIPAHELGAGSSVVAFFRTMGGAIGVSALGAVLGTRVQDYVVDGLVEARIDPAALPAGAGSQIPDLDALPGPLRQVIEDAYGHAIGDIFLFAAPAAFLSFLVVLFIREVVLRGSVEDGADAPAATPASGRHAARAAADAPTPAGGGVNGAHRPGLPLRPLTAEPGEGADDEAPEPRLVTVGAPAASDAAGATSGDTGTVPVPVASAMATGPRGGDGLPGSGVHGTVHTTDGTPVPGAALTLIDAGGRQLARGSSGANGDYSITAPAPGSYVLITAADGHQPQATTIVVADQPLEHQVRLVSAAELAGRVRQAGDGTPIAGAVAVLTDPQGEVLGSQATDADGAFTFRGIPAGGFTLAVSDGVHRPTALLVEVAPVGRTRVDVELAPGATLSGTVLGGAAGRRLEDARVTLLDGAGNVVAATNTGPDGDYAFSDLAPGQYTVVATGYPPAAAQLAVDGEGGRHELDVRLAHPEEDGA
ncbi:MFS transporter [Allostreptomyces psammosilenae]|nr:MFS transporter [Allostreptomyces psammosilenae]